MEIISDKAVRKSKPTKLFFAINIGRKYLSIFLSFTSSPCSALSGPEIYRRSTNLTFACANYGPVFEPREQRSFYGKQQFLIFPQAL
jgi:hypothetical protein